MKKNKQHTSLSTADLLNALSLSSDRHSQQADATAKQVTSPVLRDACESIAMVHAALAWALSESADANDSAPVDSLADTVAEWLSKRKVGVTGMTLGVAATIDPLSN